MWVREDQLLPKKPSVLRKGSWIRQQNFLVTISAAQIWRLRGPSLNYWLGCEFLYYTNPVDYQNVQLTS